MTNVKSTSTSQSGNFDWILKWSLVQGFMCTRHKHSPAKLALPEMCLRMKLKFTTWSTHVQRLDGSVLAWKILVGLRLSVLTLVLFLPTKCEQKNRMQSGPPKILYRRLTILDEFHWKLWIQMTRACIFSFRYHIGPLYSLLSVKRIRLKKNWRRPLLHTVKEFLRVAMMFQKPVLNQWPIFQMLHDECQ